MSQASEWNKHSYNVPVSDTVSLAGFLNIPLQPQGAVVFAHGSGSGRYSPRNQFVAKTLYDAGFATFLIDLLSAREEEYDAYTARLRFDIPLISERVQIATQWLIQFPATSTLPFGYFGASTGAAAALVAATKYPQRVRAVVSRGGRPDLAHDHLPLVQAPTLLIVGSRDPEVLALNQQALALLKEQKQLTVIEGATHLFEEPGTLEQVALHARHWFHQYLLPIQTSTTT